MSNQQTKTVNVDAEALRRILQALLDGGVEIRELMAIRQLPGEMGKNNPINILVKNYNDWVESTYTKQEGKDNEPATTDVP